MDNWKKAIRFAAMEIRESPGIFAMIGAVLLTAAFLLIAIGSMLDFNGKDTSTLFDILFAVVFIFMPSAFTLPKFMPMQRSKTGSDSAPGVAMLLNLPVEKDVIGKSRFVITMFYTALYAVPLLPIFYLSVLVREAMPPLSYIAFSIFWVSAALLFGGGMKLSADFYVSKVNVTAQIISIVSLFAMIAVFHYGSVLIADTGFVKASMLAADARPVVTSLIALIAAAVGLHFTHLYNVKIMNRKDFL